MQRAEYWNYVLEGLAQRSTCIRGHVGALIIRDRRIIGEGYNGAPPGMLDCYEAGSCLPDFRQIKGTADTMEVEGCVRATHAEANAIAFAARHGIATLGAEMWCTHSPCRECAKLIIAAGIVKLTYLQDYRLGAQGLLDDAGLEVVMYGSEGQDTEQAL